jgi:hypothetical protein
MKMLRPKTSHQRSTTRLRRLASTAILSVALALTVSPFTHPAIARADYDQQFYRFCISSLGQGPDYCCAHAGGVLRGGTCT